MKKIITLCLFVFAMFASNQSVEAQNTLTKNKAEINTEASEKTEALRKHIKFSKEQTERVYLTIREYTIASQQVNKNSAADGAEMKKIEERLETKMKNILTDEQFQRYIEFKQN